MLKNHFKIAWRSLLKSKFYTAINVAGLAVGLATGIMLLLWVQNELSYDKFNTGYQNIYQLSSHFKSSGGNVTWDGVPGPLAIFAKEMPSVKSIVRIQSQSGQVITDNSRKNILDGNKIAYVDSGFLSMFNFPLLSGNPKKALPDKNSVLITESLATKLFGGKNALGKILQYEKHPFTVTGVLKDFPENSSLRYDIIFAMSLLAEKFTADGGNGTWKTIDEDMGNFSFTTFVNLQNNADEAATAKLFTSKYVQARNGESDAFFQLQNLASIHLVAADGNTASLRMVQIFMLVVILLLAIASINYVNLSTARSLIRAKEVSIRKIIGAKKTQLFFQFIVETILLFSIALILAVGIIVLLLPLYNTLSGKTLTFSLSDAQVWYATGLAVLFTLVTSAIYPAVLLSSFKPIESLKGKITSGLGTATFRKALVVFQFSISIILLVSTIIMGSQMKYIRNKDLGYDKNFVFTVPLTQEVVDHMDAVKSELNRQPGIINSALSSVYDFSDVGSSTGDITWKTKPPKNNMMISQVAADKDFITTMKFSFAEGGNFSGMPSDSNYYILNECAVKEMGLKPPYVGQQIGFHSWNGTILGVLKDFNFQSLKEKVTPLLFFSRWKPNILYVRTTADKSAGAIEAVKQQYKKYAGDVPFAYNFLDKTFEAHYQSDQRAGTLFNVFAGIAIIISCLGLFGLATYTAQVKRKEIGIRKVLGAGVAGIVSLVSKDFLKLVVIAIVIASPVAWWAMNKWLEGFAFRVGIAWWIFILAGFIAVCIALFTISFQAVKAALANPVKSLRSE